MPSPQEWSGERCKLPSWIAAYPPASCSYGAENLSYNFYILVEFLLGSKPVIKTLRIGVEQETKMTVAARSCMSMH